MSDMGLDVQFNPRLVEQAEQFTIARPNPKKSKIFSFRIGKHRFAYTTDPGEVNPLHPGTYETHLGAIHRESENGPILGEYDLGAGVITGVGVLSLAFDFFYWANEGPSSEKGTGFNTFNQLLYQDWGKGTGASEVQQINLKTRVDNNTEAGKHVKTESTTISSVATLGSPVVTSKARITAKEAGPEAIVEWGIFAGQELEYQKSGANEVKETTGSAPSKTVTTKEAKFTESKEGVIGEEFKVIYTEKNEAGESKIVFAPIRRASSTAKVLIPEWYTEAGASGGKPGLEASSRGKFIVVPMMFDRREFAAINVEKGNIIEFPWELTIKGGS